MCRASQQSVGPAVVNCIVSTDHNFFVIASVSIFICVWAMFGWAIHAAHGIGVFASDAAGAEEVKPAKGAALGWAFVYGVSTMLGGSTYACCSFLLSTYLPISFQLPSISSIKAITPVLQGSQVIKFSARLLWSP